MVNTEKVRLMTKAAVFEEKQRKEALKITQYSRKDYIFYHVLLVLLSVTVAFFLVVGTLLFMIIMANDKLVLTFSQVILISLGIVVAFVVVVVAYYLIAHKYYGEKYIQAKKDVNTYLQTLRELEEIEKDQDSFRNEMDFESKG